MKKLEYDDLLLCRMQARIFEASVNATQCSSAVFSRRFMNSHLARRMDAGSYLFESSTISQAFAELDEEFGANDYGTVKFTAQELYWMGYVYRYWCCAHGVSSASVFKAIGARELRELYQPYHTLDPAQAIERIAQAKGLALDVDVNVGGIEALRVIRKRRSKYEYQVVTM